MNAGLKIVDAYLFLKLHSLAGISRVGDALIVFFGAYAQYIVVGVLIAWAFYSRKGERTKRLQLAFFAISSALLARLVFTEAIRFFYDRPRPFEAFGFTPLILHEANAAFPSGHAAFFFGLAFFVLFYRLRLGVWFFVAATLIGFGRVAGGIHYPGDILGGAIVGLVSAVIVYFVKLGYSKHLVKE